MKNKKSVITGLVLLLAVALIYTFSIPPKYKVATLIQKDLFIVKGGDSSSSTKTRNTEIQPSDSGICADPGCGNPYGVEGRENISLSLTGEQVTSLLNQYKSASILLNNIKVQFTGEEILASATSLYPFMPGQLSTSASLYINHFYINDVYIGSIKAPQKASNFIEANGDKMLKDLFSKYQVWVDQMEIIDGRLKIEANTPKGMIEKLKDGTILINLEKVDNIL